MYAHTAEALELRGCVQSSTLAPMSWWQGHALLSTTIRIISKKPVYSSCVIFRAQAPSVDAMFTDFFLYTEVAVAFLTLLIDWRVAVAYLAVAGLVGAFCRQPHFDGPHAIRSLSPPAFLKTVYDSGDSLSGPKGAKPPAGKYEGPAWLVAFVDPKAPSCIHVRTLPTSSHPLHAESLCKPARWDMLGLTRYQAHACHVHCM